MGNTPAYYLGTRPELKPFLPDNYTKVLEIGCGEGNFIKNLTKQCEYWGIEPTEHAAAIAEQNLFSVLHGTYQDVHAKLPERYFDLIICNDVIEHMVDHDRFLEEIKQKLSPDGCLVGSIPNVRFIGNLIEVLFKRDWRYREDGILDRTHLRFFTEKSLKRTFEQHNYKIVKLQGINSALPRLRSLKKIIKYILYRLTELITLGGSRDIKYLQFAFRIRL